jgi:hypothetical protein
MCTYVNVYLVIFSKKAVDAQNRKLMKGLLKGKKIKYQIGKG